MEEGTLDAFTSRTIPGLDLSKKVKRLSKEIAKAIKNDEKEYYETGLNDKVDISTAWKTANELLGNKKNLAPTDIKKVGKDGNIETLNSLLPSSMSSSERKSSN